MENASKYALITGATEGIGYELAKLFAADGYNLVTVARNQHELELKANEFRSYGIEVVTIAADLMKREDSFAVCSEVEGRGIQINVLVNNAGQGVYGLFQENDIERELDIIELNVSAPVILTKYFLRGMLSRNEGKILNLASIAGEVPGPWQAVYHGTKAFVLQFSEGLTSELKDSGVTVTALLPGVTDTDFFNKADMTESKIAQDPYNMADPAKVAKDGYEALMAGKDKIVSGLKNKIQVGMANAFPDSTMADYMKKQQEPVNRNG